MSNFLVISWEDRSTAHGRCRNRDWQRSDCCGRARRGVWATCHWVKEANVICRLKIKLPLPGGEGDKNGAKNRGKNIWEELVH